MLRALIFDVDGTLAETEEIHRRSFNAAFKAAGLRWHWSREQYAALLTTTGGKERIARYQSEHGTTQLSDYDIIELHKAKNQIYSESLAKGILTLRPGVARVFEQAKHLGLKLGIATTTSRSNVEALLQCCIGPESVGLFDAIVSGEDVSHKKPDPEVYNRCLSVLDLGWPDVLAFEDSGVGLKAALGANIRTIVTASAYTSNDSFVGAALVLPDLSNFNINVFETIGSRPIFTGT
jgi:HAD superfamily hydrolase (TIGR01509 family)